MLARNVRVTKQLRREFVPSSLLLINLYDSSAHRANCLRFANALIQLWASACSFQSTQPNNLQGAPKMFESAIFQHQDQGTAEEKLWRAVIARTLEEWVRGPLRYSRKAEEFLFDDNRDFLAVC